MKINVDLKQLYKKNIRLEIINYMNLFPEMLLLAQDIHLPSDDSG